MSSESMALITQASNLSLGEVESVFRLREVEGSQFFPEWRENLTSLEENDRHTLDELRSDFRGLCKHTAHEEIVKMFSLAPLLRLSGLAKYPFVPKAEHILEIDLSEPDDEDVEPQIIRGKIDIIVSHEQLWQVIVETKRVQSNVMVALPQALTYMMGSPMDGRPIFGLCTNGTDFIFVKLVRGEESFYGLSDPFSMHRQGNDLYQVVQILRHLRSVVLT
jgi:hypothetical protein